MALTMIQFSYKSEFVNKLVQNPEDRSVAVRNLIEKLGGKLLSFYFSFGEYDGLLIADMPDNITTLTASMVAAAGGGTTQLKTTILITMEEASEALKKASGIKLEQPKG